MIYLYKLCKKINIMKEKLLSSIKKLQKNSGTINTGVISFLFLTFIILSINSEGLFLKEILLCGYIIALVVLTTGYKKL